eukprot:823962_1
MMVATRSKLSYWVMLFILIIMIYLIFSALSTLYLSKMGILQNTMDKSKISHRLLKTSTDYHQYFNEDLLSAPFALTCESFNALCIKYKVRMNGQMNCIETMTLLERDFESNRKISALFILSFRREFMSYTISVAQSNQCLDAFYTLFKSIHESNYHNTNKLILSHLHVSKAAGSTVEDQHINMIKNMLNIKKYSIHDDTTYSIHNLNHTEHIFDGFDEPELQQNYLSCHQLYTELSASKALRFGFEIPLTSSGICEQFYNSVVIREPIAHSLSLLSYKTFGSFSNKGGILCKQNRDSMDWFNSHFPCYVHNTGNMFNYSKCHNLLQMKGLIHDLFNETTTETPNDEKERWRCDSQENCDCNRQRWQQVIIEYFNDNYNFGTLYYFYKKSYEQIFYKYGKKFDGRQLRAWMSNTFVRYLGYNLVNNDANELYFENNSFAFNSMLVDHGNVKQKHLDAAMRMLLQFDYVLPLSNVRTEFEYNYKLNVERKLWNFFWIESKRVLNQNKYDGVTSFTRFKSRHNPRQDINTKSLYKLYSQTGELATLLDLNRLDLKLFNFTKFVAYLDLIFYQKMS